MGKVTTLGLLVKAFEIGTAKVEMIRGKALYYVRFSVDGQSKTSGVYIEYAEASDLYDKLVAIVRSKRSPISA